ncbi:winged helix-turn-helix transcriptional regulator [Halosimplex amylolyticum]|uniref:winged helix-turn-helix transcriptional regulator n=1 Tax=Halosimplex amylolyticum TaxID=3396616 RepID=UPI003F561804
MVHKKILEVAKSNPDASLTTIAENVDGASETFVKRVIDEYGDPGKNRSQTKRADGSGKQNGHAESDDDDVDIESRAESANPDQNAIDVPDDTEGTQNGSENGTAASEEEELNRTSPETTTGPVVTMEEGSPSDGSEGTIAGPAELTDKQRETLRAVYREPTATQKEIAEHLDVTRATVSKRLNDIPGFDWSTRREFVDRLFEGEPGDGNVVQSSDRTSDTPIQSIESRLAALEQQVSDRQASNDATEWDLDLAHKMIHACFDAEYLSKEEELEVLRQIL